MIIYIGLIIYIFVTSIIYCLIKYKYKKETNLSKKVYLALTFIPLLIVMGARGRYVGTDTYSYTIYFKQICSLTFFDAIEIYPICWVFLNKMIGTIFGVNYFFFIFIISFLILTLIAKFIYDTSDNIAVSTLLFVLFYHYFNAFNGMRQYLAIAISINSFKYLLNKKNIRYILINVISILIHPTSVVFLSLLILNFVKPNFKSFLKITLFSILVVLAINPLAELFVKYFPHYQLYLDGGKIGTYGFGQGQNRSFIITIIYIFFEILMLFRLFKQKNFDDKKQYAFLFINLIGIIMLFLSLNNILFSRIAWYFMIFAIVYIPHCFNYFTKKDNLYLNIFFILIMLIPCCIQLVENINGVLPFSWFQF